MPEENGEVTAEQMLAAATGMITQYLRGNPTPFELQQEPETEPDGSQEAEAEVSEGGRGSDRSSADAERNLKGRMLTNK